MPPCSARLTNIATGAVEGTAASVLPAGALRDRSREVTTVGEELAALSDGELDRRRRDDRLKIPARLLLAALEQQGVRVGTMAPG